MPAPATAAEFLDLVRKGGLVPDKTIDELIARHRTTGNPQTVDHAAAVLVRDGLLTFFQAKQIKQGRYKRFTIGSKYRLLELIGAGGMGAVYLCEHTRMRRLVALKVLPVEKLDDHSNLERFYREARAVAALDHPNIVRAHDIDRYEKLHFLVMEYVDGASLQEIIERNSLDKKLFDPVRAAHYIAQAAVGMQHAHELGMVHRDIKPGNLLLDRTGVIKVLDMGLARFLNKQQDNVTEKYDDKRVLGTADYLAPEQAVSNIVDVRADIYSLGGTLYFMLTGQTPFPDRNIAAKLVAHQQQEPRPVEAFRSDVPVGVIEILRKMMAKNPAHRYQEPMEVAEALAEWAESPVGPPPDREMPVLCPLVRAMAAPPGPERPGGTGTNPPLARVLFGPGRGVFSRATGSSAEMRQSRTDSAATASNAAFSDAASNPRAKLNTPGNGTVSTGRTNTVPTAPLPVRAPGGATAANKRPAPDAGRADDPPPVRRPPWLMVAVAVAVAILFVGGLVVAYQLGKESREVGPATGAIRTT